MRPCKSLGRLPATVALARRQHLVVAARSSDRRIPGGNRPNELEPKRGVVVTQEPQLKRIVQVALVVRSAERTARRCWDTLRVGPWRFRTFNPTNVADMRVRGHRVDHAMRIAIAMIGDMELEIIEPLDDKSIYAEHLRAHGEGLHHILFEVRDYETAAAQFLRADCPEIASGKWYGYRYAYFDTSRSLGCLSEIYSPPPEGTEPAPIEHTYP